MKSPLAIVGIILLVIGIAILVYQGVTYTQHETIAQIGDLKVTADTQKTVYFPPIAGGVSLAAGIILLVLSQRRP